MVLLFNYGIDQDCRIVKYYETCAKNRYAVAYQLGHSPKTENWEEMYAEGLFLLWMNTI